MVSIDMIRIQRDVAIGIEPVAATLAQQCAMVFEGMAFTVSQWKPAWPL